MKQLYVPQAEWGCVESCVSIIRIVLGYKTRLPHKLFVPDMTKAGILLSSVALNAHRFFPKHEVAIWYHPPSVFGPDYSDEPPKTWCGLIPDREEMLGNYIFMYDYGTWGSYHRDETGKWGFATHTVVSSMPAFANGMWYYYLMRVSVDSKRGKANG